MKKFLAVVLSLNLLSIAGCGYTTTSTLPSNFRAIHIEQFANKVDFASERTRNLYFPLIEVDVRNAISDRFLFDGNLRVSGLEKADIVLRGQLLNYRRDAVRVTDDDNPEEFRIHITVSIELWDTREREAVWRESSFVGEATYFLTGTQARSESEAVNEAIEDLARRIVERTIENW